jgi:hypothetical protein
MTPAHERFSHLETFVSRDPPHPSSLQGDAPLGARTKRTPEQLTGLGIGKQDAIVPAGFHPAPEGTPMIWKAGGDILDGYGFVDMGIIFQHGNQPTKRQDIDFVSGLGQSPDERRGEHEISEMIEADEQNLHENEDFRLFPFGRRVKVPVVAALRANV